MRTNTVVLAVLAGLALAGCLTDSREWMKIDQKYTSAEFKRDYRECYRDRALDDACMKERGWVPVTPTKEAAPTQMDPLSKGGGGPRGRY